LLRESKLGACYLRWVEEGPVALMARSGRLRPNHITFLGFLCSLLTIPAFGYTLWLGGMILLISGIMDTLDGSLARATNQKTSAGAFLDSVLDRYSDFFMVVGIWLFFRLHPHSWSSLIDLLLFLFLSGAFLVSYSRARGEGLGLSVSIGFFGRAERVVLLGGGGLANDVLMRFFPPAGGLPRDWLLLVLLIGLTLGSHLTAFRRILYLFRHLQ
jgi:phosphatidylglycerophosphate synthase